VSEHPAAHFQIDGPWNIDVIAVLSPSEDWIGNARLLGVFRRNMVEMLSVLNRLDAPQGAARFTGIDLINQKLIFDHIETRTFDREALDKTLSDFDTTSVNLDAIAGESHRASFLKEIVSAPFEAAAKSGALHAIILVSSHTKVKDDGSL